MVEEILLGRTPGLEEIDDAFGFGGENAAWLRQRGGYACRLARASERSHRPRYFERSDVDSPTNNVQRGYSLTVPYSGIQIKDRDNHIGEGSQTGYR